MLWLLQMKAHRTLKKSIHFQKDSPIFMPRILMIAAIVVSISRKVSFCAMVKMGRHRMTVSEHFSIPNFRRSGLHRFPIGIVVVMRKRFCMELKMLEKWPLSIFRDRKLESSSEHNPFNFDRIADMIDAAGRQTLLFSMIGRDVVLNILR